MRAQEKLAFFDESTVGPSKLVFKIQIELQKRVFVV